MKRKLICKGQTGLVLPSIGTAGTAGIGTAIKTALTSNPIGWGTAIGLGVGLGANKMYHKLGGPNIVDLVYDYFNPSTSPSQPVYQTIYTPEEVIQLRPNEVDQMALVKTSDGQFIPVHQFLNWRSKKKTNTGTNTGTNTAPLDSVRQAKLDSINTQIANLEAERNRLNPPTNNNNNKNNNDNNRNKKPKKWKKPVVWGLGLYGVGAAYDTYAEYEAQKKINEQGIAYDPSYNGLLWPIRLLKFPADARAQYIINQHIKNSNSNNTSSVEESTKQTTKEPTDTINSNYVSNQKSWWEE